MKMTPVLVCYLLSFICFTLGFFGVGKFNWTDGGLAFLVLSLIIK